MNDEQVVDESAWYNDSPMRAIDLYSGVGGWTLGLRMAGVKVVRSFEWWNEANITHNKNFGTDHGVVDIRALKLRELDSLGKIDIVVGSPPCTQFSFSNRGGSGDIQDGLVDIRKFLEIVDYLKPTFWAMENVPRVAGILKQEIAEGGQLWKFRHLVKVVEIVDSANFGVPQNRRRMIAGNFPRELFLGYSAKIPRRTLGDVVRALSAKTVIDPVYGFQLAPDKLTDHIIESPLSDEERRLNEEAKRFHPIYNTMQFPDRLDRPSRTVTATCTRVSRESIVIRDLKSSAFRRLTIRERAAVQSFPITYQFHGSSYGNRQKMVGNAVPPLLTYFIASSMLNRKTSEAVALPKSAAQIHPLPAKLPDTVKTDRAGKTYSIDRRFRAAIPGLRFGSGMRFELANEHSAARPTWKVGFYYGPSKSIRSVNLDRKLESELVSVLGKEGVKPLESRLRKLNQILPKGGYSELQRSWSRQEKGLAPFELVDGLSKVSEEISKYLNARAPSCEKVLRRIIPSRSPGAIPPKFAKNAPAIIAGMLVGSRVNDCWKRS